MSTKRDEASLPDRSRGVDPDLSHHAAEAGRVGRPCEPDVTALVSVAMAPWELYEVYMVVASHIHQGSMC